MSKSYSCVNTGLAFPHFYPDFVMHRSCWNLLQLFFAVFTRQEVDHWCTGADFKPNTTTQRRQCCALSHRDWEIVAGVSLCPGWLKSQSCTHQVMHIKLVHMTIVRGGGITGNSTGNPCLSIRLHLKNKWHDLQASQNLFFICTDKAHVCSTAVIMSQTEASDS